MKLYLLLRDNKQTGPYRAEELIEKGFKPYDLIWVEGKSAGWRYPGELPEFAGLAPMVEEQPFDRFFRKPSEKKPVEPVQQSSQAVPASPEQPVSPLQAQPIPAKVVSLPNRKVFVTLPVSPAAYETAPSPVPEQQQPAAVVPPVDPKPVSQPAELPKTEPVYTRVQVHTEKVRENTVPSPDSAALTREKTAKPVHQVSQTPALFTGSSIALRAAIAACLILGGVIIGLLLSGGRQSANREELSQQLEKIRSRNQPSAPAEQRIVAENQVGGNTETSLTDPAPLPQPVTVSARNKELKIPEAPSKKPETNPAPEPVNPEQLKTVEPVRTALPEKALNSQGPVLSKDNFYNLVKLSGSNYKTGVLGGISGLQLTVTNNSLYTIDQVAVQLKYLGPEKRVVRTEVIVINAVEAGQKKTVDVPKSSRGVSVDYAIIRITPRETAKL